MEIYFEDLCFAKALKTAVLKQTTRFTYTAHVANIDLAMAIAFADRVYIKRKELPERINNEVTKR